MSRKRPTPAQRRQRELAWLRYISEGALANLEHAARVNCVAFDSGDQDTVRRAALALQDAARHLRVRLKDISA